MRLKKILQKKSNNYENIDKIFINKTSKHLYDSFENTNIKKNNPPSISVIIPCFNSSKTIGVLLQSLEEQNFPKDKFEVIIVDDGSTDGIDNTLKTLLSHFTLRCYIIHHRKNFGRSSARNTGAFFARNDILLFLDADAVPPRNLLYTHALKHSYTNNIVLTSMIKRIDLKDNVGEKTQKEEDWRFCARIQEKGKIMEISDILDTNYWKDFGFGRAYYTKTLSEMVISACISIRKEKYFYIGGFCEKFIGWGREDVFFGAMSIAHDLFIIPDLNVIYKLDSVEKKNQKDKREKEFKINSEHYNKLMKKDFQKLTIDNQSMLLQSYKKVKSVLNLIEQTFFKNKNLCATVIVPVYKDERIKDCLWSLHHQSIKRNLYEIIVVENGSRMFEDISRMYGAKYFYLDEPNVARARNFGVKKSSSEIIIFTDSDCIAPYFWLEELLIAIQKSDVVGGAIKNLTMSKNYFLNFGRNLVDGQKNLSYLPILDLPYIVTANAVFLKNDLISVGGFDETLISGSDVDICYQLGMLNKKITIHQKSFVYHRGRDTVLKYFYRFYKYAVYQILIFKKYKKITKKKFFVNHYPIILILSGLKGCIFSLIRYNKKTISRYLLDIIEGLALNAGYLVGSIKYKVIYII